MRQQENEKKAQLFSSRLIEARNHKMLDQDGLARAVGVSRRSVQNWEAGKFAPRAKDMRKLCEVLDVSSGFLLGELDRYPAHRPNHSATEQQLSGTVARCRGHLEAFLALCEGDEARLGWTLVELQQRFPLNKWPAPARTIEAPVEPKTAAQIAAGLIAEQKKKVRGPGFG